VIFDRLGLISKNQRGFTLIELLVALAITGIITGGITTTIFQVFNTNLRCSNHMIAVRQVQNAGYWFSRDAQMAQIVELTEPPEENPVGTRFPVTLTRTDLETNEKHEVTYSLEKIGEGPWQLKRSHSINGGQPSETIVAQYINPSLGNTSCEFLDTDEDGTGDRLIFKVTAKVGEGSETRIYEVSPRPIMY